MNARRFSVLIALAVCTTATTAEAAVHRVFPGDDLQAAVDDASPGDTILVEPGVYTTDGDDNAFFGLRIATDNLRLIGKTRAGQKVILQHTGNQQTGVYAAPAECGPDVGVGDCPVANLQGFEIRGFTVDNFPRNGIQTRFVTDFKIVRNESANNGRVNGNGIYPTISTNGLVQNNVSYGSLDTAMWVAASENVRVIGNEVRDSVIGLEISVSNNVLVKQNDVYGNTVGIGLFHPNAAGNAQLPVMDNWVIEQNNVYGNNLAPNPAPGGSFQAGLPPGVGILLLGVSNHVIAKNMVFDNDFVGIAVLGWCTATATGDPSRNCINSPPQADPSTNNNLVSHNWVNGNGLNPPPGPLAGLAADITHFSLIEPSSGNCYEKNKPKGGFNFVSTEPDGQLPTDGC